MARDAEPGHPDPWKNLLRRLFSLRLLQTTGVMDADGQPLVVRIHRLVQQLMLSACPASGRTRLQQTLDNLIAQRADVLEETTSWVEARWELEPFTALAGLWDEANHPKSAWLLNHTGLQWCKLAEWSRAEPLIHRALVIWEKSLGENHPNVTAALNNRAVLLLDTNRLAEAEPLIRRALAIDEKYHGPEHPDVARCLSNLAQLLEATNRLTEAEPLIRRALAINEKYHGTGNPDVAVCLNNLAQLLEATNRLEEAEPLMRRALAIDEKSYSPEHPKIAICLANLATLLQKTNRLEEAEPLIRRALAITEMSLGPEHPNVAACLNNLAVRLQAANRLATAEPLMRRVVEIFLRLSQAPSYDHPHLQDALENYAVLLLQMGRSPVEAQAQLNAVARPFGIQFGSSNES